MAIAILNPAENWDYWSEELKTELKNATSNHDIGEKLVFENHIMKVKTIHMKTNNILPFHCHNKNYL